MIIVLELRSRKKITGATSSSGTSDASGELFLNRGIDSHLDDHRWIRKYSDMFV